MKLIHIQKTYHNRNNTVHALKGIDLDLSTNGIIGLSVTTQFSSTPDQ